VDASVVTSTVFGRMDENVGVLILVEDICSDIESDEDAVSDELEEISVAIVVVR